MRKLGQPKSKPRIFIADPVCVLDHGHNPQSLLYFSEYFQAIGYEATPLAGRSFSLSGGRYREFRRVFGHYYHRYIPLAASRGGEEAAHQARIQHMLSLLSASPNAAMADDFLELASLSDWLDIWLKEDLGPGDTIFMPSADYYGVCGLLRLLQGLRDEAKPRVHLRFIGVMETATHGAKRPLDRVRKLLKHIDNQGGAITLSAESAAYARRLSKLFGQPVSAMLYPLTPKIYPQPARTPFIVYSAGAGREDKGFMRLLHIARLYQRQHPDDDVLFRVQNLPPAEERARARYCAQLYAQPNIELIEAAQPDHRMHELFREASFLILPYDQKIYRQRGSAVLMEGVAYGRPLAITANTGFHDLAAAFETMFNAATDEEFVAAIRQVYQTPRAEVMAAAERDARLYHEMSRNAFDQVFGGAWHGSTRLRKLRTTTA